METIARDFAGHYSDLWTSGKAMFVCLNKVTCVRMYDLVQKYWAAEIEALKIQIKHATQQESQELERKLQWMQETEMAVVISQEQNEIQTFQKWGLDIKYALQRRGLIYILLCTPIFQEALSATTWLRIMPLFI